MNKTLLTLLLLGINSYSQEKLSALIHGNWYQDQDQVTCEANNSNNPYKKISFWTRSEVLFQYEYINNEYKLAPIDRLTNIRVSFDNQDSSSKNLYYLSEGVSGVKVSLLESQEKIRPFEFKWGGSRYDDITASKLYFNETNSSIESIYNFMNGVPESKISLAPNINFQRSNYTCDKIGSQAVQNRFNIKDLISTLTPKSDIIHQSSSYFVGFLNKVEIEHPSLQSQCGNLEKMFLSYMEKEETGGQELELAIHGIKHFKEKILDTLWNYYFLMVKDKPKYNEYEEGRLEEEISKSGVWGSIYNDDIGMSKNKLLSFQSITKQKIYYHSFKNKLGLNFFKGEIDSGKLNRLKEVMSEVYAQIKNPMVNMKLRDYELKNIYEVTTCTNSLLDSLVE